jgi:DNA-binding GntR family transcriptional regulator
MSDAPGLTPIPRLSSLRSMAVEAIRAEIISGRLAPGSRLIERELCEQLDVSRNTLREAYRQLEAEGFIVVVPHRGPTVSQMSEREARGLFEVREALEGLAVRLFVERASAADREALLAAVDALREAHAGGDVPEMLARKNAFYDVLYRGADNDVLHAQARLLGNRLARLRGRSLSEPGRPAQSMAEIEGVVRCIAAGDADGASRLWRDHIRSAARSAIGSAALAS